MTPDQQGQDMRSAVQQRDAAVRELGGGVRLSIVSPYPPRQCGLAAFAGDLRDALCSFAPELDVSLCAVDREPYPPEVGVVIRADVERDYRRAGRQLHAAGTDVVLIQYEDGVFGGVHGTHVLSLADELTLLGVPYLVALHTVLPRPSAGQARVLAALCHTAAAVVVCSGAAAQLIRSQGAVSHQRIVVIPHGTPIALVHPRPAELATPWMNQVRATISGRRLLSTFGRLRPGKGIHTAIAAMRSIAIGHPDVCYVVAGATHPDHVRAHGDTYRASLRKAAADAGLHDQVVFADRYLTIGDIAALLARTRIYLAPDRGREQVCSGTLGYALAAGCPVVSTDYPYAREVIPGVAGYVVPPDDPAALAVAVTTLLDHRGGYARAQRGACRVGAPSAWPDVARRLSAVVRAVAPVPRRPLAGRSTANEVHPRSAASSVYVSSAVEVASIAGSALGQAATSST